MTAIILLVSIASASLQAPTLTVQLVGNAGVALSDGTTTLLIDLPYESGAFGYEHYRSDDLQPAGDVVSVITHHHRDHFQRELFVTRTDWRIVGPPSVASELPPPRVLTGDSVQVGSFAIVVVPTPHTDDHRSYRIRWHGRVLYFVGDTDDPSFVLDEPRLDLLFITPWLSCAVADAGRPLAADRSVLYHRRPDNSDRVCGAAEGVPPGTAFTMNGRPG